MKIQKILVACHNIVLAGGLLRFERFGREIKSLGHELAYIAFDSGKQEAWKSEFPILTPEQADSREWTAVFLPGAAFPPETVTRFSIFKDRRYGLRVQHVLNDQTRREATTNANQAFKPHVVVFNNSSWPADASSGLRADTFHVLAGAVDTTRFRPLVDRALASPTKQQWVVGGLANKNPLPLIAAIQNMPGAQLRLFGLDKLQLGKQFRELIEEERLVLVGQLDDAQLLNFYNSIDCVVATERFAGWANLAAEAMACGVPLICTPNGTAAFARNNETALVVGEPTPQALLDAMWHLRTDRPFAAQLALRARDGVQKFSWPQYAAKMLELLACHDRTPRLHGN